MTVLAPAPLLLLAFSLFLHAWLAVDGVTLLRFPHKLPGSLGSRAGPRRFS